MMGLIGVCETRLDEKVRDSGVNVHGLSINKNVRNIIEGVVLI